MPNRKRSKPSTEFLKLMASATVLFYAVLLFAQHPQPKYDAQTETKMKGTIDIVRVPSGAKEIVYFSMKTGADSTVQVYLCPKSFLDDMGITFAKGDEIALTGSKVKLGDADLILAREIVKGTDTIVLRDDKGKPVWS